MLVLTGPAEYGGSPAVLTRMSGAWARDKQVA